MNNLINIRFPNDNDLEEKNIESFLSMINHAYDDAEKGLFHPGTIRITKIALKKLLTINALLLAEINNQVVGCVHIEIVDENIAKFGMLTSDANYRGLKIGSKLIQAAETWAIKNKRAIMRLELLTPKQWKQAHKEFLISWYSRLGYSPQYTKLFDSEKNLSTPCDFTVYHKNLK